MNITLEWLSPLGHDEVYLDGLGTPHTPGSPTADDFCRRFAPEDIDALMEAIGVSRFRVWQEQPGLFFDEAVLDVDGTLVATPPRRRSVGAEARSREAGGAPDGVSNLRERLQSHSRLGGSFDEGDEWDRG